MKTQKTTNVVEKGEKKFDLTEAFVLWKNKSKTGTKYLSGFTSAEDVINQIRLVGFYNTNKKNPKEPDIRIYEVTGEGNQGNEVCSLWENISKNEKRYLTGTTNEKEKIIAFYSSEDINGRPNIKAYYKQD